MHYVRFVCATDQPFLGSFVACDFRSVLVNRRLHRPSPRCTLRAHSRRGSQPTTTTTRIVPRKRTRIQLQNRPARPGRAFRDSQSTRGAPRRAKATVAIRPLMLLSAVAATESVAAMRDSAAAIQHRQRGRAVSSSTRLVDCIVRSYMRTHAPWISGCGEASVLIRRANESGYKPWSPETTACGRRGHVHVQYVAHVNVVDTVGSGRDGDTHASLP